ncbi:MAG TPA: rhomboid family intramembrane serine protease [Candidatus Acidoferrales bacterium]|nr:rhomboid family intramembrane serine protease [Candidatus Acidoferrales bacterium]
MSYYTNYSGYYTPPSSFRFFPKGMKFLLVANVGIFIFQLFLQFGLRIGDVYLYNIFLGVLALDPIGQGFMPWQLVTYMFLHGGFFHIFFNMLALWMFGVELENVWGTRRFLTYYFLCGIGAGLSNLFIAPLFTIPGPTIGASGAIYGILIAFGMLFPEAPVFIYFLFPIKAKYFVAIYFGMELVYGVSGSQDGVAHFAHLGGAVVGLVYLMAYRRSIPAFDRITDSLKRTAGGIQQRLRTKKSFGNREIISDVYFEEMKKKPGSDENKFDQDKLDEILDKISASGYDSLTEDEKKILFNASKKLN